MLSYTQYDKDPSILSSLTPPLLLAASQLCNQSALHFNKVSEEQSREDTITEPKNFLIAEPGSPSSPTPLIPMHPLLLFCPRYLAGLVHREEQPQLVYQFPPPTCESELASEVLYLDSNRINSGSNFKASLFEHHH